MLYLSAVLTFQLTGIGPPGRCLVVAQLILQLVKDLFANATPLYLTTVRIDVLQMEMPRRRRKTVRFPVQSQFVMPHTTESAGARRTIFGVMFGNLVEMFMVMEQHKAPVLQDNCVIAMGNAGMLVMIKKIKQSECIFICLFIKLSELCVNSSDFFILFK